MDALAAVVGASALGAERLAGVGADPHVRRDDLVAERALDRDRGVERRLRVLERREEAVAGLLHDLAAALQDPLAHELVVAREQLPPLLVAERLEQLRRVDDVGEEERPPRLSRPRSSCARAASSFAPSRSNAASAPSSSTVAPCSSPLRRSRGAEEHPRLRRLVRRADALPLVARLSEAARGALPVLLGEQDPAAGDVHGRVERGGAPPADLVRVDDALELVRRGARGLQVARRDRNLDERGEGREAWRNGASTSSSACRDPGERAVDLALREPQEREPGLRVRPSSFAVAIRLLRAGEVAAAPANLADLVVAARGDVAVEVAQLLARGDRLLLGGGPVAAEPHDLRAVQRGTRRESH